MGLFGKSLTKEERKAAKAEHKAKRVAALQEKTNTVAQAFINGYYKTLQKRYGTEKAKEVHKTVLDAVEKITQTTAVPAQEPVAVENKDLEELQKLADDSELKELESRIETPDANTSDDQEKKDV